MLLAFLGFPVQSYGVSKLFAAMVAAWLLGRSFTRHALAKDDAHQLLFAATIWGFVGAKVYSPRCSHSGTASACAHGGETV